MVNDVSRHARVFDGLVPYAGTPPKGFYADWTGALTDVRFRAYANLDPESHGGGHVETRLPRLEEDGEGWFEAVAQVEAARDAKDHFVMITLGACYGAQAVGSYLTLQAINPLPATLVAVEPDPTNLTWVAEHFRNNGIDPDDHWLVGTAIGADNAPTLFPVGAAGSGAQNCVSTNQRSSRELYVRALGSSGKRAKEALRNLLLDHRTGLRRNLLSGSERDEQENPLGSLILASQNLKRVAKQLLYRTPAADETYAASEYFDAEIKLLSTVSLRDVLSPFRRVDYLEADIQQSETVVFPPFMDLVKRKVRRVHIGTHGADAHRTLAELFRRHSWEIVFDYAPNAEYQTPNGRFALNDGVLMAVNPEI